MKKIWMLEKLLLILGCRKKNKYCLTLIHAHYDRIRSTDNGWKGFRINQDNNQDAHPETLCDIIRPDDEGGSSVNSIHEGNSLGR